MNLTSELILQVVAIIAGGFTTYAAIRADLARLHERATMALDIANKAHGRIDALQGRRALDSRVD